ncbi:M23 family metallopeptidase [Nocardioides sp. AE5]|uniref:murein hydrolase activator EnvC family protein n=1 Tax=Nocardioides sp. AE5 TaxID=2962573 RepID=UPI0028827B53|nr:M23 family metallopeptidase [Nocardioides sp. AE5]MDT0201096.1 M23 family metallopeptidase [Nocardioides sp. AE5]
MRMRFLTLVTWLACAVSSLLVGLPGAAADPGGQALPPGAWPLDPRPTVIQPFAPLDVRWGAGHRGVDLAGTAGQVVRSTLPGTVTYAGPLAGRGVVVVDHGDTRTTYQPVAAMVSVGDEVAGAQPIGWLELAGSHCAPAACLHWGWLRGEEYLDPLDLVGVRRVRLLPLDGVPRDGPGPPGASGSPTALGGALDARR